jgi:gamma-glutamyltranspeptidase / glutathione hydrolase
VVAAGHPATVDAAVEVLRVGGNAFDAAVAAGFAAAVAEPGLSSLAGGGFLLARTGVGEEVLFDFFVDTPGRGRGRDGADPHLRPVTVRFKGAEQIFHVGHGSVAVPGCLAGYLHVHRRLGRMPIAEVVAPAIALARDGVVLGPQQAGVVRLLEPILTASVEGRARYLDSGGPFTDASTMTNPELADLLERIVAGEVTGFGDPDLARVIADDMAANGGAITADDLTGYEVVERAPLAAWHRGARLLTNPPPSFGGTLIVRALTALSSTGTSLPAPGTGGALVQLTDVMDEVTRFHTAPVPRSSKGTTHVSVADREGNLASMTTSNGSCSGVILPGTGCMANNIMGEEDLHPAGFHTAEPGQRVGSMMAPSILLPPGQEPVVLGSGGSERIRTALTQVLVALLDHGMELADAVRAPRVHWDGRSVQVEPGFDPDEVAILAAQRPVNVWEETDLYFGGVHAVRPSGERVGDDRRGGTTGVA